MKIISTRRLAQIWGTLQKTKSKLCGTAIFPPMVENAKRLASYTAVSFSPQTLFPPSILRCTCCTYDLNPPIEIFSQEIKKPKQIAFTSRLFGF